MIRKSRFDTGQSLTEYLLLLILISLVSAGAIRSLGTTLKAKIKTAQRHIAKDISFENVR